jgi:hypothetical protein
VQQQAPRGVSLPVRRGATRQREYSLRDGELPLSGTVLAPPAPRPARGRRPRPLRCRRRARRAAPEALANGGAPASVALRTRAPRRRRRDTGAGGTCRPASAGRGRSSARWVVRPAVTGDTHQEQAVQVEVAGLGWAARAAVIAGRTWNTAIGERRHTHRQRRLCQRDRPAEAAATCCWASSGRILCARTALSAAAATSSPACTHW